MKPTRLTTLLAIAVAAGLVGYLLGRLAYSSIPPLPSYAPVSLAVLALAEGVFARVVRDRVSGRGRPVRRALHPLEVARAAVLAKASSPTGALLFGGYAGYLAWTFPHRDTSRAASADVGICLLSAGAALLLVLAALALERACRIPDPPEPGADLQSPA